MATYKLKMPNSNQAIDILVLKTGQQYMEIAFDNSSGVASSIASLTSLQKHPFLEIIETSDDGKISKTIKTSPVSLAKTGDHNLKVYRLDFDQAMFLTDALLQQSQIRQTQLDLNRANENDKANTARLLNSINDITFGIQKDKMQSANKNADAIRGLL